MPENTPEKLNVIRETKSICPECLKEIPAQIISDAGNVFLRKECPECGKFNVRLSKYDWYYGALDKYFFAINKDDRQQRDYLVRLTEKCNLNCPICLASANDFVVEDLKIDDLLKFADQKRRLKIDLMAAEPTVRDDLPDIIKSLKNMGHIVALHTNGIKLVDKEYLKMLMDSGLDEVHLQMDGFEEKTQNELRGKDILHLKLRALENLKELNVATDLVMVIKPGLNEHEIPQMLDYAVKNDFVRELFFLGFRSLGKARHAVHEDCLMPDDVIDIVEEKTDAKIDRKSIFAFQKLYFAMLALLKIRKCLYIQHYLILRDGKGGFVCAQDFCDWIKVEKILDEFPKIAQENKMKQMLWFIKLCAIMFSVNTIKTAFDLMKMRIWSGFDLKSVGRKTLILGFITACDPYIYDEMIAKYCGKGEIAADTGLNESGADANIKREILHQNKKLINNGKNKK